MIDITFISEDKKTIARTQRLFDLYCDREKFSLPAGTHEEALQLVKAGIDPQAYEITGDDGNCAIHLLVKYGNVAAVRAMIKKYPEAMHYENHYGSHPIHIAAEENEVECLQVLLDAGARPNAQDAKGFTPLHYAAEKNNVACLPVLLEAGADIHASDAENNSVIHIAAEAEGSAFLLALLKSGADMHCLNNRGDTPLHNAIANHCGESARALIHAGAHINAQNFHHNTPLYATQVSGDASRIRGLLLAAGASIWGDFSQRELDDVPIIRAYVKKWSEKLEQGIPPKTKNDVMCMASVMPVHNNEAIPEPREMIEKLFRTLPHNKDLNALYKECTGNERLPEVEMSLQQLRTNARCSGVGL